RASQNLLAHRGFTHSILFALLIIPALSMSADRIHRPHDILFKKWLLFFSAEVFLHLFLDGFNNYGVGWFEPFSHHRFSFNAIYVADFFFSIWPGIGFLLLLILKRYDPRRKFCGSSVYFFHSSISATVSIIKLLSTMT